MSLYRDLPPKYRVAAYDAGPGEDRYFILQEYIQHTRRSGFLFQRKTKVGEWWEMGAWYNDCGKRYGSQAEAERALDKHLNWPKSAGTIYYDKDGDKLAGDEHLVY